MDGTGLPLARPANAQAFPAGAFFTPTLLLRNTTDMPQTATVAVQYTMGGQFKSETLPIVNLSPHDVRTVSFSTVLNSLRGKLVVDAGIRVESSGDHGAVIGQLVSLSDRGMCVAVPLVSVRLNEARSGAHPFNLAENYRSVLHLKNVGSRPTSAVVKILYEGGDYALDLVKMLPGQSVAVDLQTLKDAHQPDIHGHAFPAELTAGQVTWIQHGDQTVIGRLVRASTSDGTAANFSCGGPCSCPAVFFYADPDPSNIEGESGDTRGALAVKEYDHYDACPGRENTIEGPFIADARFTSDDFAVADVDIYGSQVT